MIELQCFHSKNILAFKHISRFVLLISIECNYILPIYNKDDNTMHYHILFSLLMACSFSIIHGADYIHGQDRERGKLFRATRNEQQAQPYTTTISNKLTQEKEIDLTRTATLQEREKVYKAIMGSVIAHDGKHQYAQDNQSKDIRYAAHFQALEVIHSHARKVWDHVKKKTYFQNVSQIWDHAIYKTLLTDHFLEWFYETLQTYIPKFSLKGNGDLYYGDDDITTYVASFIKKSKDFSNAPDCEFLLTTPQDNDLPVLDQRDNIAYLVAVTPAIDTQGERYQRTFKKKDGTDGAPVSCSPLGYFLDKELHPKETLEEVLQTLVEFNAQPSEDPYQALLKKIKDMKTEDNRLETIDDIIKANNKDYPSLIKAFQARLAEILKSKKDVFDEVVPHLLNQKEAHVKILFPYNKTQFHWLTGEIRIHKTAHNYKVEIYAHDPYGAGEMTPDNFQTLETLIKEKLTHYDPLAAIEITKCQSPYGGRQNDGISCGVIAAEDLTKLIIGSLALNPIPYPKNAVDLRKAQVKTVGLENYGFFSNNYSKIVWLMD